MEALKSEKDDFGCGKNQPIINSISLTVKKIDLLHGGCDGSELVAMAGLHVDNVDDACDPLTRRASHNPNYPRPSTSPHREVSARVRAGVVVVDQGVGLRFCCWIACSETTTVDAHRRCSDAITQIRGGDRCMCFVMSI